MKYEEYKDSGIEWIGEIPEHWKVIKLKFLSKFINGFAFKSDSFSADGESPVIRIGDIANEKISYENIVFVSKSKDLNEYKIITNDILIAMSGATVGKVGLCQSKDKGYINQRVGIIRSKDYKLIWYNLLSPAFLEYIYLMSDGSAQPNISSVGIGNYYVPFPPIYEQQTIATYLDEKCGEINHAIDVQKKKIDILGELKQTIITDAVTKGLNPNIPMKDSGVEWIGKIPAHWDVMKTSLAFNHIGSGTTPSTSKREYYDDEGAYWLQTGDLTDGLVVNTSKKISKIAVRECNLKFYPPNSVVIAMYGATIGKMGLLQIQCATNQACCVLPSNKHINAKYAFYFFLSAKSDLLISAIGGGQPNISQDVIKKTKIILPPFSEQQDIVRHLDKECGKIDAQISKANRRIELLEELKQSIITEAVTGKIKVC